MIIAVDGPAGAGKSTVARRLAQKLGFLYIDTGAMYRALTLKALDQRIDTNDADALGALAAAVSIDLLHTDEGVLRVLLDGRDVTREIRQPRITKHVSDVARVKVVRVVMQGLQRRLGKQRDSVLDGRDIGTVVFPDADRKFYIDAEFEERVRRRHKELQEAGSSVTPEEVAADVRNRDRIDSTRECSPLKRAEDAVYIDTTHLAIEEVVDKMCAEIHG